MNKLINDLIKENNKTITLNGDKAYKSTLNANLDLFSATMFYNQDTIKKIITNAYNENKELFTKNVLMIADIDKGKGYRALLKEIMNTLLILDKELLNSLLYTIVKLNRWDIVFCVYKKDKDIDKTIIEMVKNQLLADIKNLKNNENVSLLGKWLPSLRSHQKNNIIAKLLVKDLKIQERNYRKMLKALRNKINIVETKLTNKLPIDFNLVSSKAIFKYQDAFNKRYKEEYNNFLEYKDSLKTEHITYKDLVKKMFMLHRTYKDDKLEQIKQLDLMWKAKEKVALDDVLVVADTSGSMERNDMLYYALGIAYSVAEKSKHKAFITFSEQPEIVKLETDKLSNHYLKTDYIVANTDIDKVFDLLLKLAKENNYSNEDLPKHIMIISDMEFDARDFNYDETLLERQRKRYKRYGFVLPKIIYWNMTNRILPVLNSDNYALIINGSNQQMLKVLKNGLEALLDFSPINMMLEALKEYDKYLKTDKYSWNITKISIK